MKRIITVCAGLLLAAGLLTGCAGDSGQTEVTTAVAKSGRDLSSMVWQGELQAASTVDILPSGSGKVVEIPAAEGQHVEKGDVLMRIDDTDASLALAQAEASCQAASSAFENAQKTREKNLSAAPAQIGYDDAKGNFQRMQQLYQSNAVSQVDYDNAKSRMDTAAAQLEAAKNGQEAGYNGAKAQLESAQAALDIAKKRLRDCAVTAPISGLLTTLHGEIGQTVSPQTVVAAVMDDSSEKVEIQVADMDIDLLSVGIPMTLNLQSTGKTCTGSITRISSVCNPKTGMYTVTIQLDQADAHDTGLIADVRATGDQPSASVYIPAKCIQTDDSGESYVYKVARHVVTKVPVTTGRKKNAYMEITKGLAKGDEAVLQSSNVLTDGAQVRVLTVK